MTHNRLHSSKPKKSCTGCPLLLAICGAAIIGILMVKNWNKAAEDRGSANRLGCGYSSGQVLKFPPNFRWSVATSAYQTEGAAHSQGRGQSIWDRFLHKQHKTPDHSNGDIATDSYHHIEEDVQMLKYLGVNQYRFSLSWSRLLPNGLTTKINKKGVHYYNQLISALLNEGIEPVVTLYHWDLPLSLGDRGEFCFKTFGDRVKTWITLNEPHTQSVYGYCGDVAEHAPGGFQQHCEWAMYLAAHHMLLAHGRAARLYQDVYQKTQKGKIGITLDSKWTEPSSDTVSDREAADLAFQSQFGWFAHPIFSSEGDYPMAMQNRMYELSRSEGRSSSRLPTFTPKEIMLLKGSADFLGLNYYISLIASTNLELPVTDVSRTTNSQKGRDIGALLYFNSSWPKMGPSDSWIRYYPEGLRKTLNYVKEHYANVPVLITENGCMDRPHDGLNDEDRIFYLKGHLESVWRAIHEDGVNVFGYTVWSLLDNFEWNDGFTRRFGLYHVDFHSSVRTRTPKRSAKWYKEVANTNSLRL
ncbi:hypothetical protein QR680_007256 [Steinernema hermaphroditum]|uniref:Beta-glucosidase n=1 Tax=Steinernema hermaphroditum TaxID=289476 RepID=A0AA39HZE9_9BILA|nr:hypothetical protein QR680_007256 [Steinernema hermaphroditum]